MIKKYGLTEGEQRWKSYCDKQSETNSFDYKNKKYGMTREEFNAYNSSRAVTLENMISRYGEAEGNKKWEEYCERQRYTTTKEYFIEQYGEKDGLTKYLLFCDKRSEQYSINIPSISNISIELFNKLYSNYITHIIYYNINEYKIITLNNVYFVDYYDETLNIVIEFYGSYWHMDPKKYPDDYIMLETCTAKEKREKDRFRIEDIQSTMNCKVIVVWESTYRHDKHGTVDTIIKMIDNKDNLQNITYI